MKDWNIKKYYLCCRKKKKELYKRKIQELSISPILIMETMKGCDEVLCISNMENPRDDMELQEDITLSEQLGIHVIHINENLVSNSLMQDLLDNKWGQDLNLSKENRYEQEIEF